MVQQLSCPLSAQSLNAQRGKHPPSIVYLAKHLEISSDSYIQRITHRRMLVPRCHTLHFKSLHCLTRLLAWNWESMRIRIGTQVTWCNQYICHMCWRKIAELPGSIRDYKKRDSLDRRRLWSSVPLMCNTCATEHDWLIELKENTQTCWSVTCELGNLL